MSDSRKECTIDSFLFPFFGKSPQLVNTAFFFHGFSPLIVRMYETSSWQHAATIREKWMTNAGLIILVVSDRFYTFLQSFATRQICNFKRHHLTRTLACYFWDKTNCTNVTNVSTPTLSCFLLCAHRPMNPGKELYHQKSHSGRRQSCFPDRTRPVFCFFWLCGKWTEQIYRLH